MTADSFLTFQQSYPTMNDHYGMGISSRSTTSYFTSSTPSMAPDEQHDILEGIFFGPRDIVRHSKWPYFLRLQGSVLPRMIIPLLFVGIWSTTVVGVSKLVYDLGISSVLLTITGFVVGLSLSFRSSTAYERYTEGRKYWSQLLLTSRNTARLIWVHVAERNHDADGKETPEIAKQDLLNKIAAINLLNAFAVALKHRLRFEPSVEISGPGAVAYGSRHIGWRCRPSRAPPSQAFADQSSRPIPGHLFRRVQPAETHQACQA